LGRRGPAARTDRRPAPRFSSSPSARSVRGVDHVDHGPAGLIERLGEPVGEAWAFPTRDGIAEAGEQALVDVGFTRRKAEYAVGLARSDLDLGGLAALDDDAVRARITALRGLGPWTAEWYLARHLARPQAWPAGDLALRKAAESLYGVAVTDLGARLHPFQNLSAHYLLTGWLTRP
jgi:3-methyladenine DNA glycosylase/8-oxoguanine DNA glycosylase